MIGARVTHVVTPVFPSSVCCLCSRACVLPGLGGVCARLRSPRTALCFGVLTLCVRPVSVTVTCVRVCVSPHMPAPCVYFLSRRACSCGIWHIARFLRPGYSLWLCGCSVVLCYLSALYCYRVCHLCTCAAVSLPDARAPPQGSVPFSTVSDIRFVFACVPTLSRCMSWTPSPPRAHTVFRGACPQALFCCAFVCGHLSVPFLSLSSLHPPPALLLACSCARVCFSAAPEPGTLLSAAH